MNIGMLMFFGGGWILLTILFHGVIEKNFVISSLYAAAYMVGIVLIIAGFILMMEHGSG